MGGLFSKPKTPELPKPKRMPDEDDPQNIAARRQERQRRIAGSGRASTILDDSRRPGSQAYSNQKLGQ